MPDTTARPGSAYVPAILARLSWGGRMLTATFNRDPHAPPSENPDLAPLGPLPAEAFVHDVLAVIAQMGLLKGAEDAYMPTREEALELASFLVSVVPADGMVARRYGDGGVSVLRSHADLELVLSHAEGASARNAELRATVQTAGRTIRRYLNATNGGR